MASPRILAFSGSLREASFNTRLVHAAANAARKAGAEVTVIELRNFPLPIYDEDLEAKQGLPANVVALKTLFREHQGLIIASPEYNSSISAALKNVIDWVSRPEPNQPPMSAFNDKLALLMSASPGGLGGLRGLVHLRAILGNINVTMLPDQFALVKAHEAFNADGTLKDEKSAGTVAKMTERLTSMLKKLNTSA